MSKRRILVLGIGQTNFLSPLYKAVKKYHSDIEVHIANEKKLTDGNRWDENEVFDGTIRKRRGFQVSFLAAPLLVLLNRTCRQVIFIALATKTFSEAVDVFSRCCRAYVRARDEYRGYQYYHIHFITLNSILAVPFLPRREKVILSFWGSDLMRHSDLLNHYLVGRALDRADAVTIQSIELKEILLIKYGRKYEDKVRVNKFVLDARIFAEIDKVRERGEKSTITRQDKINILVGHNAKPENNHKAIIDALSKLPPAVKGNLNLIFVFGYGIQKDHFKEFYTKQLKTAMRDSQLQFTFVNEFLHANEIAKLRVNCDVVLHFPVSDALSSAVTESLYAGAIVVTGAWLPYGTFRRAGVRFKELETIDGLSEFLPRLFHDIHKEKELLKVNKNLVYQCFLNEAIEQGWASLYDR